MKLRKIKYSIPAMLLLGATYVHATSVKEVVQYTMAKNPEIMSINKNNDAFKYYIDEEKGGYYPKVDLTAYIGTKKTKDDPDTATKSTTNQDGYNGQLDIEQLLYDGGYTPGRVDEAQRKYSSNELGNRNRIENIMYESISAYLGMVEADEMKLLAEENIKIHDEYMVTAKQTEEISGESLNRIQVGAKIHFAKNKLLEEVKNKQRTLSNFEKSVGMSPEGFICRPNENTSLIPDEKQKVIELALKNNYEILEQIENIKEQRAIIRQSKAEFLPSLKFKAQAIADDDLLNNDAKTDVYSGRIELTYNLFNGTKDTAVKEREVIFLQESQKTLDTITSDIVDRLTVAFDKYQISKNQIIELKQYIAYNQDILSIYQDQFEGGTRKFIDVLNAESDIYNAKTTLVNAEYELYDAYYEMFSILSNLNTTVLASEDQVCKQMQLVTQKRVKMDPSMDELSDLLEEVPSETPKALNTPTATEAAAVSAATTKVPMDANVALNDALANEFSEEISNDILVYDNDLMSLKLSESYLKKNKLGVMLIPEYKKLLKDVFPRYVAVTKSYEDKIKEVRIEGHSSSRYDGSETADEKFEMNEVISLQRAVEVLRYGTSLETGAVRGNIDFIRNTYKAYGMASSNTIKNTDGTENELLSKRVEFVIVPNN